jgi:hypothetical protein
VTLFWGHVETLPEEAFSPESLAAVFAACNKLVEEGIIQDYALGGGLGALYYTEPFLTYDADIFYEPMVLDLNAGIPAIFQRLKLMGHAMINDRIAIKGLPTQFLTAHGLTQEALKAADPVNLDGVPGKIFRPEYLAAIAMQVNRTKDKLKAELLLDQSGLDTAKLDTILRKHGIKRTV